MMPWHIHIVEAARVQHLPAAGGLHGALVERLLTAGALVEPSLSVPMPLVEKVRAVSRQPEVHLRLHWHGKWPEALAAICEVSTEDATRADPHSVVQVCCWKVQEIAQLVVVEAKATEVCIVSAPDLLTFWHVLGEAMYASSGVPSQIPLNGPRRRVGSIHLPNGMHHIRANRQVVQSISHLFHLMILYTFLCKTDPISFQPRRRRHVGHVGARPSARRRPYHSCRQAS